MKTKIYINKDHDPSMEYPWHYLVMGPLGSAAPCIDYGHMETRERAQEAADIIVRNANTLSLGEMMDKYGMHWTFPDG